MTSLLPYWPEKEEINRCIKTEAETASDAVLLAVHQETPLSIRNAGSTSKSPATEGDLLDSFLSPDLPEGTLLLAITGASGAGKSHMIRWLAAHLERDPRSKNMHVIRVPKSANLRTVVELILEPLGEDERFAKARRELEEAVSSVNPEYGAIHFAANLDVELREEAKALEGMIREDPKRADVRDLKIKLDHARRLPDYFNDSELTDHFKGKVLPKIVERAIVGQDDNEEEKFPQFAVEDLKLPEGIGIGNASTSVRRYFQTVLNKGEDDDGYRRAVDVLNGVVDRAIRNLFRLNQAMGGVTLEEIVLQIRKLLMEEGKELVLLIEDFAALSGIQEVLLSVCIQEAVRSGQQVRAPMRTALAVTDGYLTSRDTILTRAKREWIVESDLPNNQEILERTERLVAAYLNAARWGEANLISQFENSRKHSNADLTGWIEVYRDENEGEKEANLLAAFGKVDDIPIFPFNTNALERLANDHLLVGGELLFNPRKIINHIIREPLLLRDAFESEAFPPESFSKRSARASIASWVSSKRLGGAIEGRLRQAIIYWGGNPDTPERLSSVEPGVFKAFNLPTPTDLGIESAPLPPGPPKPDPEPVPNAEPRAPKPAQPSPPSAPPQEDEFVAQWSVRLDSWVEGVRLTQNPANTIRNAIAAALNDAIDWNAACMKPVPIKPSLIELPNALGGPVGQKRIVFAKEAKDSDGRLRETLLAFLRFEDRGRAWSYPEADKDTALIANALDRLIPEYLSIVTREVSGEIGVLASALTRQAQVLGIAPKRVVGRQSIVNAVFSQAPRVETATFAPGSAEERWHTLRQESATHREELQEALASKLGAFQGTGNKVYAIDVARLSLDETDTLKPLDDLNPDQRNHVSNLSMSRLRVRCVPLARQVSEVAQLARSALGEDFDKQKVYAELKHLAESAEEAGVWPASFQLGKRAFVNRLDKFRDTAIVETLDRIDAVAEVFSKDELMETIHHLGKIRLADVEELNSSLRLFDSFMKGVEAEVRQKENQEMGMGISELVNENRKTLSALDMIFSAAADW